MSLCIERVGSRAHLCLLLQMLLGNFRLFGVLKFWSLLIASITNSVVIYIIIQ